MKNPDFEKIEQYLNGEMSMEEQKVFESELVENEELATIFTIYKTIEKENPLSQKLGGEEAALKKTLQRLNATYFAEGKNKNLKVLKPGKETPPGTDKHLPLPRGSRNIRRIRLWNGLKVAAFIAVVAALGVIIYTKRGKDNKEVVVDKKTDTAKHINNPDTNGLKQNSPSENLVQQNEKKIKPVENNNPRDSNNTQLEKLFADNFEPDPPPDNMEGPLEDAFSYYQSKDYKNAIASIENADLSTILRGQEIEIELLNFYSHYYKGLSYIAGSTAMEAIPELKKAIAQSPADSFRIKSKWYLALAYLKTGNQIKAKELLKQVAEGDRLSVFKLKADGLIKELK